MKSNKHRRFLIVTVAAFSILVLFGYYFFSPQEAEQFYPPHQEFFPSLKTTEDQDITRNTEKDENENLNFHHYVAVGNSSTVGEDFDFVDENRNTVQTILRNETFKRKPVVSVDPNTPFFDLIVPVTGASSNHFRECKANIEHFSKQFPGKRVIFYDLGLDDSQVSFVKSLPFVTLKKFEFASYPAHVRNLHNYAWKTLIIQQILAEFDGVMWFDSSVKFNGDHTHAIIERLVRHKSGFMFYVSSAGHSIITATHPRMMEYLPMEKTGAVKNMLQGGAVIVINTAEVQKYIMKWLVVCVLKTDCIAPDGSTLWCNYNFPRESFGGCHRYDQSILNILVSNAYNYEEERYHFSNKTFAIVNRM